MPINKVRNFYMEMNEMSQCLFLGNASVFPQPDDMEAFIRAQMYDTTYTPVVPSTYPFPSQ